MESSKFKYRVITAPGGKFRVQFSSIGLDKIWQSLNLCLTKEEAIAEVEKNIEMDDFAHEVIA